jgi:hypothetical protein
VVTKAVGVSDKRRSDCPAGLLAYAGVAGARLNSDGPATVISLDNLEIRRMQIGELQIVQRHRILRIIWDHHIRADLMSIA